MSEIFFCRPNQTYLFWSAILQQPSKCFRHVLNIKKRCFSRTIAMEFNAFEQIMAVLFCSVHMFLKIRK